MKRLVTLVVVLCLAQSVNAADEGHRKLGLGWDDGPSVRYRPNPHWGVGLRAKFAVYWIRPEQEDEDFGTKLSNYHTINIGLYAYYETPIGEWLSIGPVVAFNTKDPVGKSADYELILGLRPALAFEDRIVFETRFGISIKYTRTKGNHAGLPEFQTRNEWDVGTVGTDVGPQSVVQFFIYF